MALRARLSPPEPEPGEQHRYHEVSWAPLPSKAVMEGDRRFEAETYLASGFGIRRSIEARRGGWIPLAKAAEVWQPPRLKGIQVSPKHGKPFLAATQVFDIRPVPRKWLAIEKTPYSAERFVKRGTILVTCSGSVGRATLAFSPHLDTLISHDLLRVEARDEKLWGWLYAFLRAPKARAMMTSAHYGHIIKHLEVSHLNELPIPELGDQLLDEFSLRGREILDYRDRAHEAALQAEEHFERCLGAFRCKTSGENGFVVHAGATIFCGRRRIDAWPHNPLAGALLSHLECKGIGLEPIRVLKLQLWLPDRFKRIPAADGITLLESSDLFELNPDAEKRIFMEKSRDPYKGTVRRGWLLVARSGQIYGLNGSVAFATLAHENTIVSDDIIRIAPTETAKIRLAYLWIALSHPLLGRPLVKALAYGSSIPHIDPGDLLDLQVVRLPDSDEELIAELAEKAANLRAKADVLENEIAAKADIILTRFMAGDSIDADAH